MIGFILAGHGNFATGLASAAKLIAGEQENFIAIDFLEGMSSDDLAKAFKKAISSFSSLDGVVVFTDLMGGSPFNQASLISTSNENVRVISGTNLPMIVEMFFQREFDIDSFVEAAVACGISGISEFDLKEIAKRGNNEMVEDDGI